jgi:hypothetical protein
MSTRPLFVANTGLHWRSHFLRPCGVTARGWGRKPNCRRAISVRLQLYLRGLVTGSVDADFEALADTGASCMTKAFLFARNLKTVSSVI